MAVYQIRKKCLFILIIILNIFLIYLLNPFHIDAKIYYFFHYTKSIKCYRTPGPTLPKITDEEPIRSKSIFFHETSCNSHISGKIILNARQACAVESAAKMNPNWQVYLLFASPGVVNDSQTETDRIIRALQSYKNIKLRHVNMGEYSTNTPVQNLYEDRIIDGSSYPQSHASDIFRYLTLWKFGGIYLDLDVIVIKSFDTLPKNFAGSESDHSVAAGIMGFEAYGLGHQLAQKCLYDLKDHFQGTEWGENGPGVITRLSKEICHEENVEKMIELDCGGFKVFGPKFFYAIRWQDWKKFFLEDSVDEIDAMTKDSYIIHVWNKHSGDTKIPIHANQPYINFARKYCPKVIGQLEKYF